MTILFLLLFSLPTFAASSMEVVQSVPIETSLAVPGIRQTQEVWLEMINGAQKSLDFEEFYLSNKPNEPLDPILAAIRKKAASGVQVRMILDSKFYKKYPAEANELAKGENIHVRTVDFASGVQHSKFFIVDRSQLFEGSANFDWLALEHIHEVGLRINNVKNSEDLESIFERDWAIGTPVGMKPAKGLPGIQIVASPSSLSTIAVPESASAIVALLASAKKSLRLQVYEYATKDKYSPEPWKNLDTAIRDAASRGVHVQLLFDTNALKEGEADLKALAKLKNIKVRIVRIPEWTGGHLDYARLVHSKYVTVDHASAWVGTENWTGNYFRASRNVGVIAHSSDVAGKLDQIFEKLWNSTYASPL